MTTYDRYGRIIEIEHRQASIFEDGNGRYIGLCECLWETRPRPTPSGATVRLEAHIDRYRKRAVELTSDEWGWIIDTISDSPIPETEEKGREIAAIIRDQLPSPR